MSAVQSRKLLKYSTINYIIQCGYATIIFSEKFVNCFLSIDFNQIPLRDYKVLVAFATDLYYADLEKKEYTVEDLYKYLKVYAKEQGTFPEKVLLDAKSVNDLPEHYNKAINMLYTAMINAVNIAKEADILRVT